MKITIEKLTVELEEQKATPFGDTQLDEDVKAFLDFLKSFDNIKVDEDLERLYKEEFGE